MKRRDFVKSLPILALSPLILTDVVQNGRHLIVIGSAATRMIAKHTQDLKVDSITVINDEIPVQFKSAHTFLKFEAPASAYDFVGDRKIMKRKRLPEIQLSPAIKQYLKNLQGKLIIITALGGYTGTTHYQAIMKFVSSINIDSAFICSLPFEFEGSKKFENAMDIISQVGESTSQSVFAMDGIRVLHGNLSVRSAFEKADGMMMKMVIETIEKSTF